MSFKVGRGRKELNINHLIRPEPTGEELEEKSIFASRLLAEEDKLFDFWSGIEAESGFASCTFSPQLRMKAASKVLKGMLMRERFQAAAFHIYLKLCRRGICSLRALEAPVNWSSTKSQGTCLNWIFGILERFDELKRKDFLNQDSWGIQYGWIHYDIPIYWLAIMIGRTFTSLDAVVKAIRVTGQFGTLDDETLAHWSKMRPDSWAADTDLHLHDQPSNTGTFAFWLPHAIAQLLANKEFDAAAKRLSEDFYGRLENTEYHYARFFGIDQRTFNADIPGWKMKAKDKWDWD
ncbi:hypothetical protein VTL71DRAFT_14867 [Oculimacula yallundae]|uniref:Uncharacterized protein n=1 Tax=Oculimacula yallundae TaxID=86028 RepID=A0ABR4CFJ6_9HELO